MTYAINGTALTLQPETGQWLPRELIGFDGNGRPIYAPTRRFELKWGFLAPDEYDQLQTFFDSVGATGSVVVDLPEYGNATWQFFSYSGCYVQEPFSNPFFWEHYPNTSMIVTNIRT